VTNEPDTATSHTEKPVSLAETIYLLARRADVPAKRRGVVASARP
jgi:hypothetical protein